jgi:hypothetical protein
VAVVAPTTHPSGSSQNATASIAAGDVSLCDGVALVAGASTILEERNQGAPLAPIDA